MKTVSSIQIAIRAQSSPVVLRREFASFGSPSTVSRAFAGLVKQRELIRLGVGVYAKVRDSGEHAVLVHSFDALVIHALNRLGVKYELSPLRLEYMAGNTDQIPAKLLIKTLDRSRRRLACGRLQVEYVAGSTCLPKRQSSEPGLA